VHPEPPRCDTDQALEVTAAHALIREAGARRDLCRGEVRSCLQKVLSSLDAAHDDVHRRILVRGNVTEALRFWLGQRWGSVLSGYNGLLLAQMRPTDNRRINWQVGSHLVNMGRDGLQSAEPEGRLPRVNRV
jgi:hypothetical protein